MSLLLHGNYGNDTSPLLFFECLYQIPSQSPEDLKKLFAPRTDNFDRYLHQPSLERIARILNKHSIKAVLIFTGKTFESVIGKPGISKNSRQTLRCAAKMALDRGDEQIFWRIVDEHGLRAPASLPDLEHECTAIKMMDTRAKDWWKERGWSVFSHALDHALKYAREVG